MKMHFESGVYWLESTFEERGAAKAAQFLWHPRLDCMGDCAPCKLRLVKVWWTNKAGRAHQLREYAEPSAKEALEKYEKDLEWSRACDVDDPEEFKKLVPSPDGLDYLPYQRAGIRFGLTKPHVLIGDEMGLGKTIQGIGIINATKTAQRVLVLCPASLKINWKRELEKWMTRPVEVHIGYGEPGEETLRKLKNTPQGEAVVQVLVINYDVLKTWYIDLMEVDFDIALLDEVHYVKNPRALRSQLVLGVWDRKGILKRDGLVHRAKKIVMLTGTPITNRPIELFPLLQAIDTDGLGESFMRYALRYCNAQRSRWGWDFRGASNLDELQDSLRNRIMVRRLKKDVLKELPPKTRQIIDLAPGKSAGELKRGAEAFLRHEEAMEQLEEAKEIAEVLGDEEAFREAATALAEARQTAFDEMSRERHTTAMAKVPAVIEHLLEGLEGSTGKFLVFAHHKDVVHGLEQALDTHSVPYVTITGNTSMKQRQANVDAFQEDDRVRVFIGNIQAAGVGLTLTKASTVLFAELDWTPANMLQAEDRAHRIGQVNPVLVQYLVFDGSVDAKMCRTLIKKMEVIEQALDTEHDAKKIEFEMSAQQRQKREYPHATEEQKRLAAQALQQLAGMCDGAATEDGRGFNKMDTQFGKQLAERSMQRPLSDAEVFIARRMCRKYHRQLPEEIFGTFWVMNEALGVEGGMFDVMG